MATQVHVHDGDGKQAGKMRDRLPLTEAEAMRMQSEERQMRRYARLVQVRQQSTAFAATIRHRRQKCRCKDIDREVERMKAAFEAHKAARVQALQQQVAACLVMVGQAHRDASNTTAAAVAQAQEQAQAWRSVASQAVQRHDSAVQEERQLQYANELAKRQAEHRRDTASAYGLAGRVAASAQAAALAEEAAYAAAAEAAEEPLPGPLAVDRATRVAMAGTSSAHFGSGIVRTRLIKHTPMPGQETAAEAAARAAAALDEARRDAGAAQIAQEEHRQSRGRTALQRSVHKAHVRAVEQGLEALATAERERRRHRFASALAANSGRPGGDTLTAEAEAAALQRRAESEFERVFLRAMMPARRAQLPPRRKARADGVADDGLAEEATRNAMDEAAAAQAAAELAAAQRDPWTPASSVVGDVSASGVVGTEAGDQHDAGNTSAVQELPPPQAEATESAAAVSAAAAAASAAGHFARESRSDSWSTSSQPSQLTAYSLSVASSVDTAVSMTSYSTEASLNSQGVALPQQRDPHAAMASAMDHARAAAHVQSLPPQEHLPSAPFEAARPATDDVEGSVEGEASTSSLSVHSLDGSAGHNAAVFTMEEPEGAQTQRAEETEQEQAAAQLEQEEEGLEEEQEQDEEQRAAEEGAYGAGGGSVTGMAEFFSELNDLEASISQPPPPVAAMGDSSTEGDLENYSLPEPAAVAVTTQPAARSPPPPPPPTSHSHQQPPQQQAAAAPPAPRPAPAPVSAASSSEPLRAASSTSVAAELAARRPDLVRRFEARRAQQQQQQQQVQQRDAATSHHRSTRNVRSKGARVRKGGVSKQPREQPAGAAQAAAPSAAAAGGRMPPTRLLAAGPVKVPRKEARARTERNYKQLPEVQRRAAQAEAREQWVARQRQVRERDQKRRQRMAARQASRKSSQHSAAQAATQAAVAGAAATGAASRGKA